MTPQVLSTYLTRRLGVPPRVAQAGFDVCLPLGRRTVVPTSGPRVHLELRSYCAVTDGTGYAPFRSCVGVLRSGFRSWTVRLELMPWSADDTELGLRRVGGRGTASPGYFAAGSAVLADVAAQVRRWTDEPLQDASTSVARAEDLLPQLARSHQETRP